MTNTEYDNEHICPKCSGQNDYKIVDSINLHPCEVETKCTECGWEDYWAYGFYESRGDEAYDKYVEKKIKVRIDNRRIYIDAGNKCLMDVPLDLYLCTDSAGHKDLFGWTILETLRDCYKESVNND